MRSLDTINKAIAQCQKQIAATYNNDNYAAEDAAITREGFQKQLEKLNQEHSETQRLLNLKVINPRLVIG